MSAAINMESLVADAMTIADGCTVEDPRQAARLALDALTNAGFVIVHRSLWRVAQALWDEEQKESDAGP